MNYKDGDCAYVYVDFIGVVRVEIKESTDNDTFLLVYSRDPFIYAFYNKRDIFSKNQECFDNIFPTKDYTNENSFLKKIMKTEECKDYNRRLKINELLN
jgi:hypothetical protein